MRTYEVFLKKEGRDPFSHAGSLEAPNRDLAVVLAREALGRRGEGDYMWIVDRADIIDVDRQFLAAADRPHRHNDGELVRAHRESTREDS